VLGSMERFFGTLIEHYAGAFPTWLAPVQIKVLPIADKHAEYAKDVYEKLFKDGFRAEVDYRNEKVNAKIRDAELEKVPYMIIIGDKEIEQNSVSIRKRRQGNLGTMQLNELISRINREILDKVID